MLPLSNVMQLQFVSCGSFELSKLFSTKCGEGKRIRCDFQKLDLKQRFFHTHLPNSSRKIRYKNRLLKALASPNVSIVHTAEKVATYRFWTENGGQLKIIVKKKGDKYLLCVEVVYLQTCEGETGLVMSWGLFRSDSKKFMSLEEFNGKSVVETPFVKDSRAGLAVELDFDSTLAPFYVSILLKSKLGFNGKTFTIRSHRKTNFVVPVGFGSGRPFPMGLSFCDDGFINFSFFSRNVENVVLCLFEDDTHERPSLEIDLDKYVNRTGAIWHVQLDGSMPFVSYGYRCKNITKNNEYFALLDPYAKVIKDSGSGLPRKCLTKICQEPAFDWSGDVRPNLSMEKLIVYRLDVGRFTKDKSSKLSGDVAGSFSGISEKIHHFKNLGVNAVLLEPVFPFDEQKGPYFPWHFFSPRSLNGDTRIVANSMKEMVKKLHASGIEVLLDVVFTHTSEIAPLREIDTTYYRENTSLNCNHPVVLQMILESLRHWVINYHVDGFIFINASSLTKGTQGELLSRPPLVEAISFDPLLSKVKIIADSWNPRDMETKDVIFPHWKRWGEMNSKFSIDVRNFLRGQGPISKLATRLCGSGDLFLAGRGPGFSINYITRNLGFTLVDLVSFSSIEVETELGWNCGEEGPTKNTTVLETRLKQIRNFFFILFISLGVPVINMGDECGQSTGGSLKYSNQKSLDWNALKSGFGIQITEFISFLSSLKTRRSDLLQSKTFLKEENIEWRGADQTAPMWDDLACKFLALTLKVDEESTKLVSDSSFGYGDLFVAFNSANCSQEVTLPQSEEDSVWVRLVDTALPFPRFFTVTGVPVKDGVLTYEIKSHSCILFEARRI